MSLERVEHLRYIVRDTVRPHMCLAPRHWDVGDIPHTQEHFFFQVFSGITSLLRGTHPSLVSVWSWRYRWVSRTMAMPDTVSFIYDHVSIGQE